MSRRKAFRYLVQLPPSKAAWALANSLSSVLADWAIALAIPVYLAGLLAVLTGTIGLVDADLITATADALMLDGATAICVSCVDGIAAVGYVPEGMRLIDGHVAIELGIIHALRRDFVWWSSLVSSLAAGSSMLCLSLAIKGGNAAVLISSVFVMVCAFLMRERSGTDLPASSKKGSDDD